MKKIWSIVGTIFVILFIIGALITVFVIDDLIIPKQTEPIEGKWVGLKEVPSDDYNDAFPVLFTINFEKNGTGTVIVEDMIMDDKNNLVYLGEFPFSWKKTGDSTYISQINTSGVNENIQIKLAGNYIDVENMGSFKHVVENESKANQSFIYNLLELFAPYHDNYDRAFIHQPNSNLAVTFSQILDFLSLVNQTNH